jgi:hypothetical protein
VTGPRRIGSTLAALMVATVLLAGCRGAAPTAAAPVAGPGAESTQDSAADPIGSIEATISSVESGFAADSGDDAGAGR